MTRMEDMIDCLQATMHCIQIQTTVYNHYHYKMRNCCMFKCKLCIHVCKCEHLNFFSALTSAPKNQLSLHLHTRVAMHAFNITSRFRMAKIFCSRSSSSIFCASIASAIFSSIFLSLPTFASKSFYRMCNDTIVKKF